MKGSNTFHFRLHIERFILVGTENLGRPQPFGLLASLSGFRNTAHEVAPFGCWERSWFLVEHHLTTVGRATSIFN